MRVIGLAGWSGAGKTTLLVKLLAEFARRGVAVSTIKHAHHGFDIDQPGKDSFEHRRAGAHEVLVASGRRWALVHELRGEPEPPLAVLLGRLAPVDLVVVEGFKRAAHPKIEVFRQLVGKPPLFARVPNVRAIATDTPVPGAPVPVLDLDDVAEIATQALGLSAGLSEVIAALETASLATDGPLS